MTHTNRKIQVLAVIGGILTLAAQVQACPVCFAAPDSPESRGMTMAILFLLGTIGVVLCGMGSFFFYLMARQKEPLLPYAEFSTENQSTTH